MRSHFLTDLPIHGKQQVLPALPDFDFYNLRAVTSFNWSSKPETTSRPIIVDFMLDAIYQNPNDGSASGIRLCCSDVKQLRMPDLGTSFSPTEIEIEDLSSDQLEGIRYRLKDFGATQFEVLCGTIEISMRDSGLPSSGNNH